MGQKMTQRRHEWAAEFVAPGERVRHAASVKTGPLIAVGALGPIGILFLKEWIVAVTDTTLYVMSQKRVGGGAKAVEERMPLGSIAVRTGKHPWPMQITLVIGEQKFSVAKPFHEEVEKLVAAASAGGPR